MGDIDDLLGVQFHGEDFVPIPTGQMIGIGQVIGGEQYPAWMFEGFSGNVH